MTYDISPTIYIDFQAKKRIDPHKPEQRAEFLDRTIERLHNDEMLLQAQIIHADKHIQNMQKRKQKLRTALREIEATKMEAEYQRHQLTRVVEAGI